MTTNLFGERPFLLAKVRLALFICAVTGMPAATSCDRTCQRRI